MCRRNSLRCAAATLAILLSAPSPVHARDHRPGAIQPASDAPPPPAGAIAAYEALDAWVRAWDVPDGRADELAGALCVTLRLSGRVIGRGIDSGRAALERAARQAIAEATPALPVEHDALRDESLREVAQRITISLELAGPLVPIVPAQFAEVAAQLSPGLHGVAARIGERTEFMFPGTMLATNTDPGAALVVLASKLTGDPTMGLKTPAELRDQHAMAFYRFRISHLAQTGPGEVPIFLSRAGRLIPAHAIDAEALLAMADGMAHHLARSTWPGVEPFGVMGTMHPVRGIFDPVIAAPVEQAVAALALARYARTPGIERSRAAEARDAARRILLDLADVQPGEQAPWADPVSAAATIIALLELGDAQEDPGPDGLLASCRRSVEESAEKGLDGSAPEAGRSLIAWALVHIDRLDGAHGPRSRGAAAVRETFLNTPPGHLASQMPWLGWAELELAGTGEIAAGVALRELRSRVWLHQFRPEDLSFEDRDLFGGVVFTADKLRLPTWQTVRPVAFLATMLGDPRLTEPAEVPAELAHLLASLRFIRQLAADRATGHMYAFPDRAMWGVRAAPWDQRMPRDATSLSLLAVCETLASLGRLSER